MDLRNKIWHGQLQVSGIGDARTHTGSIMSIMSESLKDLQELNPRSLSEGKEIILILRDKPFTSRKESTAELERALEVGNQLDDSNSSNGPEPGETYEAFMIRLVDAGMTSLTAAFVAADWFDQQPPIELLDWLNDSKAARFRQLNSSNEAYESASPNEYIELKRYVLERFPEFTRGLVFRIA